MAVQDVTAQIVDELGTLPLEEQRKVLAFIHSLASRPKGVEGASLLHFAGSIPPNELAQMRGAIDKGFEHIEIEETADKQG